jgi:hypothetical protein
MDQSEPQFFESCVATSASFLSEHGLELNVGERANPENLPGSWLDRTTPLRFFKVFLRLFLAASLMRNL